MRYVFTVCWRIIKTDKTRNNLMSSFITTWRNTRFMNKIGDREDDD